MASAPSTPNLVLSRRLLIASAVFGLFVLLDIALFGWLIFRSLSQREIERVLLETRSEAEGLAKQIARRAERQGKDLYTAVATERETQTYIDSILREREIVQSVEIRDKNGVLVFQSRARGNVETGPPLEVPPLGSAELPNSRVEKKTSALESGPYEVPDVSVPIGDFGKLQIGISAPALAKRIEVLRRELIQQSAFIGIVSVVLLLSAYVAIWLLLRRSRRLEVQAAEAERMAYIGTLASGLAHEIRNPLNSLNLNMQMLEEELDENGGTAPTGKRLLGITRSEISRLERLATDFLAYAKPRPLDLEEIAVARLLERVPDVLAGEIQKRRAQVIVNDRSGGARVRVDPAQINQLLLNLVQNALLAAEDAGRTPVVRLTAQRQGPSVLLDVEDNGTGIPPAEQPKIFDLFYSTRKGGTGLGLAIVDRIVRAHNGRMTVDSIPGKTVMTLELPLVTTPEPAARPALETAGTR
ncbi:MAG TPA: ATP-binding protein [Thermoanaerobaculia bacterium]|jgi:signal transduction histidine kinase|nr:ATP-binding protein [Thermoanaerobaculia bacterium]